MSYPCHYTNSCPHKPHKHAHTHTHTHTHDNKRYTFIIGLKHNYHRRQSCPQISTQTKLFQNAAFPEALGTFSKPAPAPPLQLLPDALHGQLSPVR